MPCAKQHGEIHRIDPENIYESSETVADPLTPQIR
jgi:hypothetical protein